jgi:ABC-2 type transport system permease protein
MVREKEQGTIVQVYASSLSAVELILGKTLAYLLIGLLEAVVVITLGSLMFGLWFVGDPTPTDWYANFYHDQCPVWLTNGDSGW